MKQLGVRQARYLGAKKQRFQMALITAVANLSLAAAVSRPAGLASRALAAVQALTDPACARIRIPPRPARACAPNPLAGRLRAARKGGVSAGLPGR